MKEQYCPWCGDFTEQVIIQYEPAPNGAQRDADDIPTDDLQLAAGTLCCACGDLISVMAAEATRTIGEDELMQNLVDHLHDQRDEAKEQYQASTEPPPENHLALGRYHAYVSVLGFLVERGVEI